MNCDNEGDCAFPPPPLKDLLRYFDEIRESQGAGNHEIFDMRLMQLFVTRVYSGEGIEEWVLEAIANGFSKVLAGSPWNDEFPLPWCAANPVRKPADEKGLQIYCWVENEVRAEPSKKITELLQQAAENFSVSYELARQRYYEWQKKCAGSVSKNDG